MMEKYDVVHIQLFACIVKEDDPAPMVKNLMSLLSKCVVKSQLCPQRNVSQRKAGECGMDPKLVS